MGLRTNGLAVHAIVQNACKRGILLFGGSVFPLAMPKWGSLKGGKAIENTWNARLVEALHKIGMASADFEVQFTIRKGGKAVPSKPDIAFRNGGVHLISGKFGAHRELAAYRTADEYKEHISATLKRMGGKIGEVFAVTYPSGRAEKFHLHVLPTQNHDEMSLTLDTLEEVAEQVKLTVEGLITQLERRQESVLDEARRLLRWGAEDLAGIIKGITLTELETVFGGHDFFHSVLEHRLKGEKRTEALRLGAAYLFINQILFYILLSRAAERAGQPDLYPPIDPRRFDSPKDLRDLYFERVHLRNYEPVYGLDVAQFFKGEGSREAAEELVRGIIGLAPKLDVPDLVGQVFQTLIPFEIRKPLGAHYTNPRTAMLLANLAIDGQDATAMDPACGSGTLLVAAYRRKMALAAPKNRRELHTRFMEQDITGIDAMAFAAHLAAVNLALQEPLIETEHVRVGIRDSTGLRPGIDIEHTEEALATELRTVTLDHDFSARRKGKRVSGPVKLKAGTTRPFHLGPTDLVIMNPPFTRWSTMAKGYRDAVRLGFAGEKAEYRQAITKRPGQHLFFLLLADRFLKKEGRIASVLPLATFKEAAYQPFVRFLLHNYTIQFIVVGLGLASYSEDTSLTECLLVATKRPPQRDSTFTLIGTYKAPDDWTQEEIDFLANRARMGKEGSDAFAVIRQYPQEALAPEGETLMGLYLRLLPQYEIAISNLETKAPGALLPIVTFSFLKEHHGVDVSRGIETSEHFSHYGPKALLGYRREEGMGEVDRLVYTGEKDGMVVFRDRIGGKTYRSPSSAARPALRALFDHRVMDITGKTDFCFAQLTAGVREAMTDLYGTKDAKRYLARVNKRWSKRVIDSSSRLLLFRRGNLSAPGTRLLCFRCDEPALQAGTNYLFRGLDDPTHEKFLCLWLNSTPNLIWFLREASITEGAYITMEKFGLYKLPLPDFTRLTQEQRLMVDQTFERLSMAEFPSLLEQLETHYPARIALDDFCLHLLGFVDSEIRAKLGRLLREGAAEAIRALKQSMEGAALPEEDEEEDAAG